MIVKELVTKLGFKVDSSKLRGFEARLKKVSKSMMRVGKSMTIFVTLPIIALGAGFIKAASDAEETASKFSTVFKSVEDDANAVADNLKNNFGLSSDASKKLLSDTGDLLTGFGFTGKMALDLSQKVNELAVDLASFTNFAGGAEGASAALTKALLGERESVKSLGISILEEDVKKQVAIQRSKGLRFETKRQAKAYATLTIAQNQSKNAIGDFARTQDQFANQMRILKARIGDLAVSFGKVLLPMATKLVRKLVILAKKFGKLSEGTKKTILILLGVAAVIGPLVFLLGAFIKSILLLKVAFLGVGKAALWFSNIGLGSILLKVGLVVAAFLVLREIYRTITGEQDTLINKMSEWLNQFEIWDTIMQSIADTLDHLFNITPDIVPAVGQKAPPKKGGIGDLFDVITGKKGGQIFGKAFQGPQIPGIGKSAAGPRSVTNNFKADIKIEVPSGTNTEELGNIVRDVVSEEFDEQNRKTLNTVTPGSL